MPTFEPQSTHQPACTQTVVPAARMAPQRATCIAGFLLKSGYWPRVMYVCLCSTGSSQIDTLVLLDRTVDPLTPFCTQLTYEGLIDETFHIKNGVVQLEAGGVNPHS